MMAPGQDYYHRLLDGEVYLFKADEKLCLACAERRGLLAYDPKGLREPIRRADVDRRRRIPVDDGSTTSADGDEPGLGRLDLRVGPTDAVALSGPRHPSALSMGTGR